jgi:hypothetical protein
MNDYYTVRSSASEIYQPAVPGTSGNLATLEISITGAAGPIFGLRQALLRGIGMKPVYGAGCGRGRSGNAFDA